MLVCLFFVSLLALGMTDGVKREQPHSSGCGVGMLPMKAPDFTGEGSFARFSADLDAFYAIHNFTDELKLRFLPLCLSGVARDAFEAIPAENRSTYENVIKVLSENFRKPSALDAHAKLRNLRFDSSLSLDAFVVKFKHLMSQAFPGQLSDQVLFHTFLPILPARYQEHIIAQGIGDFEEAVRRVRNLVQSERFQQPVRQVSEPEPDRLEQILQRVEELERRLSAETSSSRVGAGAGAGTRAGAGADARGRRGGGSSVARSCYCCGSAEHFRAACPLRDCFCARCGRRGHTVDVCRARGKRAGGRRYRERRSAAPAVVNVRPPQHVTANSDHTASSQEDQSAPPDKDLGGGLTEVSSEHDHSVGLNNDMTFSGTVAGTTCCFLLDTGSSMSIINRSVYEELSGIQLHPTSTKAKTASQSELPLLGRISVPLQVASQTHVVNLYVSEAIDVPCILGLDFMSAVPCVIDLSGRRLVLVSGENVRSISADCVSVGSAVLGCDVSLPAGTECVVKGYVHNCGYDGDVVMEPNMDVPGV